jgi:NAD(P)-dependent dehydrogenase (short-subunit alcohol dehydrogenase family)
MVFSQRAYHVMAAQESGGSIINIGAQASLPVGAPSTLVAYGAAKAGLNHMTRSLSAAWGAKVRVNCLSLGWVRTDAMVELLLSDGRDEAIAGRIPIGRMGTPDDIGALCVFLASDAASYINDATIWVVGGGM